MSDYVLGSYELIWKPKTKLDTAKPRKIKTLKRQAYGFRDHEFFKLKILAIHESKYALVG